jgi:glycosyltransferase involved in cell wall biosynthesis
MRVVVYVLNDVSRDSRVLREASTLVAAGHEVVVVGRAPGRDAVAPERRDGFEIRRLPMPARRPLWFTWLDRPWALWGLVGRDLGAGPRRWPRAAIVGAVSVVTLPWVVIRGAWVAGAAAISRQGDTPTATGPLDYLARWWFAILPWTTAAADAAPPADVHHASDLDTLPAALRAAARDGARVVYDAHEVTLAWGVHARQPRTVRWAMARWERGLARRVDAIVTVNPGCAAELGRRLGHPRIVVVRNCPPHWTPPPSPGGAPPADRLRTAAGLAPDVPVVLCHGGFQAGRGLEETAEAMTRPGLEPAHLVFLGYTVHAANPIVDRIAADARLAGRVHVLPAVAPAELLEWVAGADVGAMPIQPTDRNHVLSTPNKLFECIAAGVPVVSSDFPERRAVVVDDPLGPLGAVCDPTDPDAIAAAIRSILELDPAARDDLRARCRRAAAERWNWETEGARLLELYASFAPGPAPG